MPCQDPAVVSHLNFQIAPEGAVLFSPEQKYTVTFRHVNCADYCRPNPTMRPGTCGIPMPADCSCNIPVRIAPPVNPSNEIQLPGMMQVCPGGCNEGDVYEWDEFDADTPLAITPLDDETIGNILYEEIQAICKVEHPRGAQVIEILEIRLVWSKDLPIPAYFSPRMANVVAHSSAVTSGHLALMQARRNVDNIEVDFRTYDSQLEMANILRCPNPRAPDPPTKGRAEKKSGSWADKMARKFRRKPKASDTR
ncbi:hypothetical protein SAMD00023353_10500300 [Rosellinia necatrix]|uniref:Uncharacterized protein n=1 Tax=Rosellinia necatrix TaxID=77044 RepID=A0A1S8AB26_ROSNE|nr:hypothetical protein SAMD00023353_10500300 [Rosellinia necatrix]